MAEKIVPQEACMLCFPEQCACPPRDKRKRPKTEVKSDVSDSRTEV